MRAHETPPNQIHHLFNHLRRRPASEQPVVLAQNCPNTGAVIINTANEETLVSQYQPYPTGTPGVLKRYRFVPPGAWPPNKKFPTVLMVPPNVFKNDHIID